MLNMLKTYLRSEYFGMTILQLYIWQSAKASCHVSWWWYCTTLPFHAFFLVIYFSGCAGKCPFAPRQPSLVLLPAMRHAQTAAGYSAQYMDVAVNTHTTSLPEAYERYR